MILVTGCAGFIGHAVVRTLLARGERVIGIDNLNAYYDPALKQARLAECAAAEFTFFPLDLCDPEGLGRLFSMHRPTRVVHRAAQAGVRYSFQNPCAYVDSNITGFVNMLECVRAAGNVEHLVYNLGNNHPEPLLRFIDLLESAIGRPARRVPRPMQPGDVRSTAADIDLTTRELNGQPTTSIETGLPRLVDWVRRYYAYDAR